MPVCLDFRIPKQFLDHRTQQILQENYVVFIIVIGAVAFRHGEILKMGGIHALVPKTSIVSVALAVGSFIWEGTGAAIATVLGQIVSSVLTVVYLRRFKSIRLTRKCLIPQGKLCLKLCSLGVFSFFLQLSHAGTAASSRVTGQAPVGPVPSATPNSKKKFPSK